MQDTKVVLENYSYTALSENVYHPYFENGRWYFDHSRESYSLLQIAYLCRIPNDELTFLKITYGG